MPTHTVSLPLPEHVYEQARRRAQAVGQAIEAVLVHELETRFSEPLPTLPPDEQAELDALVHLSDEALWTIAREQMTSARQERLTALMDGNNRGQLAAVERAELNSLVSLGQRLMLRKAQATAILTVRGYVVRPSDLT